MKQIITLFVLVAIGNALVSQVQETHIDIQPSVKGTVVRFGALSAPKLAEMKAISDTYVAPPTPVAPPVAHVGVNSPTQSGDKAFIYEHESGNMPCKINGGRIDCSYNGPLACGLGQSLPCSKLTSVCSLSDYACQDNWFTNYMLERYGSWAKAAAFWRANAWW